MSDGADEAFHRLIEANRGAAAATVRACLGRAKAKGSIDAESVVRGIEGSDAPEHVDALWKFLQTAVRIPDGFGVPRGTDDVRRILGGVLHNEHHTNMANKYEGRGRSDERTEARPVLAAWVRAEVKAACRRNNLPADTNLRILAGHLADEAKRAAAEDREPNLAPGPVNPTYWALHRLYHRG